MSSPILQPGCLIYFLGRWSDAWEASYGGTLLRMTRSTLILPVRCGGLALPDLRVYFWATILVTVQWWFLHSRANAAVCLKAASLGSLQELKNLIYQGTRAYPALPYPTRTTLRVWTVARKRFTCLNRWSPFTPLWGNPTLPHLRSIPDPQLWARYGIKILRDILVAGRLLSTVFTLLSL